MFKKKLLASTVLATSAFLVTAFALSVPSQSHAARVSNQNYSVVYFTRHAEKMTTTENLGPALTEFVAGETNRGSNRDDVCGASKCAEELSDLGLLRAQLLANWFDRYRVTRKITHVYSSHKVRTRQTVEEIALRAGLENDSDLISDGVQQLPADGTELNPQSTGPSEGPTIDAILNLQAGDVAVVAGHSGTIYDIMDGLGIDTSSGRKFPRDEDGKVRDFGDLWKVIIKDGQAYFQWRINLQPVGLRAVRTTPSADVMQ